jgi:Outer membrane protein beta-barrel domain
MRPMKNMMGKYLAAAGACMVLFGVPATAHAVDTAGKFRVEPALFAGGGLSKVDLGQTTRGDTVSISGGGGAGVGLTLGYGIAAPIDIDLTLGYEKSQLNPVVDNATGSFTRSFYLATILYRIPIGDRFNLKVGGGGGFYKPGKLDIDATAVTNGFRDVIEYKNASGAHAVVAFEIFADHELSVTFGLKYYSVTYKEASATRNGAPGFMSGSKIENLDGSGFDLSISLAKYF